MGNEVWIYVGAFVLICAFGIYTYAKWPGKKKGPQSTITPPEPQAQPTIKPRSMFARIFLGDRKPAAAGPATTIKQEAQSTQNQTASTSAPPPADTQQAQQKPIYEAVSKVGVINALVLDDQTRSFGERHVELKPEMNYGRPMKYFNNVVFYLHRLSTGQILPVPEAPYQNLEHSPGETYRAVKTIDYIRTVFGKRNEKDNTKIWMIVVAIIAVFFIGLMASQSKKHGGP